MSVDKIHKYLYNKVLISFAIGVTLLFGSQKITAKAHSMLPVVIEVVYKGGQNTRDKLLAYCGKQTFINANDIYEWHDHLVIYGKGYERIYSKFKTEFKEFEVKFYDHPFYDFERSRCSDKKVSKHWDNIILTADLVADPKKQAEYLEYHRTQFEKWPEVSQGFCNANFQQLLVFKNGRQLMLVISIPKGESLDKLNPLTTKNNPRVDDWNKIMAKYQEGIPGTKPGETWVFLKPMK